MLVILPILCFIFMFLILADKERESGTAFSSRRYFLSAAVAWAVLLTAITEALSIFKALTQRGVLAAWLLAAFMLTFFYYRFNRKIKKPILKDIFPKKEPFLALLILCASFIIIVVGFIALVAPTNNWDSMVYHMARVMHWIQNHSLSNYPTHAIRQITYPPWAEFAIFHLQILSGGDRFANLIQWFGMVGSVIGVSFIAKQLGADFRGQVFSAVICATIPSGILEGSSTQNDYILSFWLVCLASFVISAIKERIDTASLLKIGASLGLVILTKGTGYVYAAPVLAWFALSKIRQPALILKSVLIIAIVAVLINAGYYIRNIELIGFPLPLGETGIGGFHHFNQLFNLQAFISSIIREAALHAGTNITFLNGTIMGGINFLHRLLGVDINDPRLICPPDIKFCVPGLSYDENIAGNPIHCLLIVLSIVIFLTIKGIRNKKKILIGYLAVLISAFLLYCLLITWQIWGGRLHLPLFVLFSVFVGITLSSISNHKIVNLLMLILFLSSLSWVFYNTYRPIIANNNIFNSARIEQYFNSRPWLKEHYMKAAYFIKSRGCSNIGLAMPDGSWEYPFWVLLKNDNGKAMRIEHIDVNNPSAVKSKTFPFNNFNPSAIISFNIAEDYTDKTQIYYKGRLFFQRFSSGPVKVYMAD